jgi:hypothetical protein
MPPIWHPVVAALQRGRVFFHHLSQLGDVVVDRTLDEDRSDPEFYYLTRFGELGLRNRGRG